MSEDEQAKKLTQDLFDAAVDRAIINQKAQGREFSLQDIKRLKAKHVFDKEDKGRIHMTDVKKLLKNLDRK